MSPDTAVPTAPAGFDPFSPAFLDDPHRFWQTARDRPVFFHEPLHCWVLSRHEDIGRTFRDWQSFSSRALRAAPLPAAARDRVPADVQAIPPTIMKSTFINMDPPGHTVHRKNTQRALTRSRVAAAEPEIRAAANRLIDGFIDQGHCDLMSDYCHPLTLSVIISLIGLPTDIVPQVRTWIDDLFGLMIPDQGQTDEEAEQQLPASPEEIEARYIRLGDAYRFFEAYLERRRNEPGDDLASAMLLATTADGTPAMSNDQIITHLLGAMVAAGSETTANLIAQMVRYLSGHRDVLDEITQTPELWERAVEEGLRRFAIANNLLRVTTTDVELHGVRIPAHSAVLINVAGANSDAAVFPDPLEFDIHRENIDEHLAFGVGRHFCLGAPLARLETRCGLEELYKRLPSLTVDPDQLIEYNPAISVRGLRALAVSWEE
jgi:cytochrome P450